MWFDSTVELAFTSYSSFNTLFSWKTTKWIPIAVISSHIYHQFWYSRTSTIRTSFRPSKRAHDLIQRRLNVDATSWRCIDVDPTLYKRHVPAVIEIVLDSHANSASHIRLIKTPGQESNEVLEGCLQSSIVCWMYSLDLSQRGDSNECTQHTLSWRKKVNFLNISK